jgi:hypothetical protein
MPRLVIFELEHTLVRPRTHLPAHAARASGVRSSSRAGTGSDPGSNTRSDVSYEWLSGRVQRLQELARAHIRCAVISNQEAVAFGARSIGDVQRTFRRLSLELGDGVISRYAACYTHPDATEPYFRVPDDPRRLPNPGMIAEIMDALQLREPRPGALQLEHRLLCGGAYTVKGISRTVAKVSAVSAVSARLACSKRPDLE